VSSGLSKAEQAAESAEIGGRLRVKVDKAPVDQIAAQLSFQIAKTPALSVLEHAAAQKTIGSDPLATRAQRSGMAGSEAAADQFD